jgi:hypothetical protein
VVNKPILFTPNYLRFLMNRFREELPFTEVPIRIVIRARRQREDDLHVPEGALSDRGPRSIARGRANAPKHGPKTEPGEELLDDEHSTPVDIDLFSDDAADYFDDDDDDK